jgi:hypothetical protein
MAYAVTLTAPLPFCTTMPFALQAVALLGYDEAIVMRAGLFWLEL